MPGIGIDNIRKLIEMRGSLACLSVVGSQAYGLANEESDIDLLGVYVAPTAQVLSLGHMQPKETIHKANRSCGCLSMLNAAVVPEGETYPEPRPKIGCEVCDGTGKLPDFTVHEVGKFVRLAAAANPTVLELLFIEPDTLGDAGWAWNLIQENRDAFISTMVRRTYGGYAKQQLAKKKKREAEGMEGYSPKTRYRDSKHTRHIVRLFLQEKQILETGAINPRLTDEEKELVLQSQSWTVQTLEQWMNEMTLELLQINNNISPEPDYATINELLLTIRGL